MGRTDSFERPWCWERLKVGGEGDKRGWDGWMASSTQWTWVWASSGSWWWTGLYRASPSLAEKNIINLISLLTIWWCPCVESSLVLLEEGFAMTSPFSWQNSISLSCFILYSKVKSACYSRCFLTSYFSSICQQAWTINLINKLKFKNIPRSMVL